MFWNVEKSDSSNKLAALRETFEEIPGLRDHGIDVLDYEYPFGSEEFYRYDIRAYLAELQTEINIHELEFSRSEVSNLQFLDFDTILKPERVKQYVYKSEKPAGSMNGISVPVYDISGTESTGESVNSIFGWQALKMNFTLHNLFPERHNLQMSMTDDMRWLSYK